MAQISVYSTKHDDRCRQYLFYTASCKIMLGNFLRRANLSVSTRRRESAETAAVLFFFCMLLTCISKAFLTDAASIIVFCCIIGNISNQGQSFDLTLDGMKLTSRFELRGRGKMNWPAIGMFMTDSSVLLQVIYIRINDTHFQTLKKYDGVLLGASLFDCTGIFVLKRLRRGGFRGCLSTFGSRHFNGEGINPEEVKTRGFYGIYEYFWKPVFNCIGL